MKRDKDKYFTATQQWPVKDKIRFMESNQWSQLQKKFTEQKLKQNIFSMIIWKYIYLPIFVITKISVVPPPHQ